MERQIFFSLLYDIIVKFVTFHDFKKKNFFPSLQFDTNLENYTEIGSYYDINKNIEKRIFLETYKLLKLYALNHVSKSADTHISQICYIMSVND